MLALGKWRDERCGRCGGDLAETTAAENDGTPGNSTFRRLLPVRCHKCTALMASEEAYKKQDHAAALIHRAELVPPRTPPPA